MGGVFGGGGGGGSTGIADACGVLRTSAVDDASSCFTSSSLMSSCFTTGVGYGSSLASSRREGLRSQSGDSRSMGRAEICGRKNTEQPEQLRRVGEKM